MNSCRKEVTYQRDIAQEQDVLSDFSVKTSVTQGLTVFKL